MAPCGGVGRAAPTPGIGVGAGTGVAMPLAKLGCIPAAELGWGVDEATARCGGVTIMLQVQATVKTACQWPLNPQWGSGSDQMQR